MARQQENMKRKVILKWKIRDNPMKEMKDIKWNKRDKISFKLLDGTLHQFRQSQLDIFFVPIFFV